MSGNDMRNQMNKQEFLKTRVGEISEISVRELVLFAENDGDLYRQSLRYINYNMGQFYKKGRFDLQEAVKGYKPFIDMAAKKYGEESIFNSAEKWAAAYEMAENNLEEMKLGNFTESRN